ncbi:MAG: hypothetical protein IT172_11270 [Acidobacteria bacterium]|nr:hypothetical protein [Acidobacteriota bacterium]
MKDRPSFLTLLLLIGFLLSAVFPCGPGYISPVFNSKNSPEYPYTNYAAGQLGIVKPGFGRALLLTAYRYVNGGSFSPDEQKALTEIWKAQIDRDFEEGDNNTAAIKAWVEKRKEVMPKDEKLPDIYTERSYGGYNFFPNCAVNAFETATATLASRIAEHGAADTSVKDWVMAQDDVFRNCASGRSIPGEAPVGSPTWLQKDRAYQQAAAEFYSLDYNSAKKRFQDIALDTESPWAETADYLVARTLIRQASLAGNPAAALPYYEEAEAKLDHFISPTGKFAPSANRLLNLVKYRLHPEQRVLELAQTLAYRPNNDNFKQDVIDYTWLLDKYENETFEKVRKRTEAEEAAKKGEPVPTPWPTNNSESAVPPGKLALNWWDDANSRSVQIIIDENATDADAIAAAERELGKPLTDAQKKSVREERASAYSNRYSSGIANEYEGGWYTDEQLSLGDLPAFLRGDDLTDWLYTFQTSTPEAYLHSLKKFSDTGSEIWLMSALSQARTNYSGLPRLFEAAQNVSTSSPAYQTIAFHHTRLLLDLGKTAEARKIIDDVTQFEDNLPISTRNSFSDLKRRLAGSMDEFIRTSLRKPYAWDFSGSVNTLDNLIADQKSYYDPEYEKGTREEFEQKIEESYKLQREFNEQPMLDRASVDLINTNFSLRALKQALDSDALPENLKANFAIAVWTRAWLLDDKATVLAVTPILAHGHPEMAQQLDAITSATTQPSQDRAILYFVLKNPILSPFVEDGTGKTDNDFGMWDDNDWWCTYSLENEDADGSSGSESDTDERLTPPPFITAEMKRQAGLERKKMLDLGNAPQMLAERVLAWAKAAPADKRVPEALYIAHQANGWTKYGCGSNEDLQNKIAAVMKKSYASSEWTRKLDQPDEDQ